MSKYNNFTEVSISGVGSFPTIPQVITTFRGNRSLMFVCTSGTNVEYSFDGINVHDKISSGQIFSFTNRNESKIWFRGTGAIAVHSWGS